MASVATFPEVVETDGEDEGNSVKRKSSWDQGNVKGLLDNTGDRIHTFQRTDAVRV